MKKIRPLEIVYDRPNFPAVSSEWRDRHDISQIVPIMEKINEIIERLNSTK